MHAIHGAAAEGTSRTALAGSHPGHWDVRVSRTGLWLFLLSESMVFVLLLVVRFVLAGRGHPAELNQALAAAMTVVLLASGIPARQALVAISQGDPSRAVRQLWLTVVLGALFLAGMAMEWSELAGGPAVPLSSAYGTVFFTTTGFHGLHLLIGLLLMLAMILRARRGRLAAGDSWSVEAAEKYWHFVDGVWIAIYVALYLL